MAQDCLEELPGERSICSFNFALLISPKHYSNAYAISTSKEELQFSVPLFSFLKP